jgi:hypothetical protein
VEFERRARGLRLIETDDYLISATVEDLNLVFGKEYSIRYDIVNKSGKPLEISLAGRDDKSIRFEFQHSVEVTSEIKIEGSFYVHRIEEEQNVWRTHPAVTTEISINGKKALFKVGIVPKFPAKVSVRVPGDECFTGVPGQCYVDLENNFNENAEFKFQLSQAPFVRFEQEVYQVSLKAKERKSVAIPYTLNNYGFYAANVEIDVKLTNGEQISFTKEMAIPFKGLGAKFSGISEENWHIYNGYYEVALSKFNNLVLPSRSYMEGFPTYIMSPKLGKPFSSEFSKKRPEKVEFFEDKGAMVLKAMYQSNSFPDFQLLSFVKLYAEGIIEHYYEVKNVANVATGTEVWLNHPMYHELYGSVFPYDGQIMELKDSTGADYEEWDSSKVSENWMFTKGKKVPRGICWSPKYKVNFERWYLFFEYNLGKIPANTALQTEPTFISIGAYHDWESFRAFALRKASLEETPVTTHVQFSVNQHNPVVGDQCLVTLKDYKSSYFQGDVQVNRMNDTRALTTRSFTSDDEVKEVDIKIDVKESKPIDILRLQARFATQQLILRSLLLKKSNMELRMEEGEEEGLTTYSVDNGVLQMKAAPQFSPSLYSLSCNGSEWLDTSFPTPQPKSWWNPWGGGVSNSLRGLSNNSILKEKSEAEFVQLADNLNNEWQGLKVSIELKEHDKYKGLKWNQYFLTLPGVPIVCQTTEIIQETGTYFDKIDSYSDSFINLLNKERNGWMKTVNKFGEQLAFRLGNGAVEDFKADSSIVCGTENRKDMLCVTTDLRASDLLFYSNNEVALIGNWRKLNLKDGDRIFTPPVFYLITDQIIPEDALGDLKKIRF